MRSEKLSYGDKSTITVRAKVPHLSGVDTKIAAAYTSSFKAALMKELKTNSIDIEEGISGGSEEQCDEHSPGKCVTHARFKLHAAQIYKNYATVSYELSVSPFGAHPQTSVRSLTVNLRTGDRATPGDFIATGDPHLASAIRKGKCLEDYDDDPTSPKGFQAFSPTDDGLKATWAAGTNSYTACGIGEVTLSWADFGTGRRSASATPTKKPKPTHKASGNTCVGNPPLPRGAAPEGCATRPKNAKVLPSGSVIITPTTNIFCSVSADVMDCFMNSPRARFDLKRTGPAYEPNRDDGPAASQPVEIPYGTSVVIGGFACSSESVGLTCWSTSSKHGLFLAKEAQLHW
jgi:hypothetical protein